MRKHLPLELGLFLTAALVARPRGNCVAPCGSFFDGCGRTDSRGCSREVTPITSLPG